MGNPTDEYLTESREADRFIVFIVALAILAIGGLAVWANQKPDLPNVSLAGSTVLSDDGKVVVFKHPDGGCTQLRIGMPAGMERSKVVC